MGGGVARILLVDKDKLKNINVQNVRRGPYFPTGSAREVIATTDIKDDSIVVNTLIIIHMQHLALKSFNDINVTQWN